MPIEVEDGDFIDNEDAGKMFDLGLFLQWLINDKGVAVQAEGKDLDGAALGALTKEYVLHGPHSAEAYVRAMQAKGR